MVGVGQGQQSQALGVEPVAHAHPRLALPASLPAGIAQFIAVPVHISPSEATAVLGHGKGLFTDTIAAVLLAPAAYLQAALMALFFVVAAAWGALAPRRQRLTPDRFFDQSPDTWPP